MAKTSLLNRLLKRFVRAFIAGAAASMAVFGTFSGSNWSDVAIWINALALAGIVGGISGLIMAVDKYFRSEK